MAFVEIFLGTMFNSMCCLVGFAEMDTFTSMGGIAAKGHECR